MKPKFEVADILRRYGNAFFKHNDIPKYKRKILHDIEKCRTAYFGGHITECPDCGHREASYIDLKVNLWPVLRNNSTLAA